MARDDLLPDGVNDALDPLDPESAPNNPPTAQAAAMARDPRNMGALSEYLSSELMKSSKIDTGRATDDYKNSQKELLDSLRNPTIDGGAKWTAFAAGMLSPTKTGAFSESMSSGLGALAKGEQQEEELRQHYRQLAAQYNYGANKDVYATLTGERKAALTDLTKLHTAGAGALARRFINVPTRGMVDTQTLDDSGAPKVVIATNDVTKIYNGLLNKYLDIAKKGDIKFKDPEQMQQWARDSAKKDLEIIAKNGSLADPQISGGVHTPGQRTPIFGSPGVPDTGAPAGPSQSPAGTVPAPGGPPPTPPGAPRGAAPPSTSLGQRVLPNSDQGAQPVDPRTEMANYDTRIKFLETQARGAEASGDLTTAKQIRTELYRARADRDQLTGFINNQGSPTDRSNLTGIHPDKPSFADGRSEAFKSSYGKKEGEEYQKKFSSIQQAGSNSQVLESQLGLLKDLYASNANIASGPAANTFKAVKGALRSVGVPVGESARLEDVVNSLSTNMALHLRTADGQNLLPGAVSNYEDKMLKEMAPVLTLTPEGRMMLIDVMIRTAKFNQGLANKAREFSEANNNMLTPEWEKVQAEHIRNEPMFSPTYTKAIIEKYRRMGKGKPNG